MRTPVYPAAPDILSISGNSNRLARGNPNSRHFPGGIGKWRFFRQECATDTQEMLDFSYAKLTSRLKLHKGYSRTLVESFSWHDEYQSVVYGSRGLFQLGG